MSMYRIILIALLAFIPILIWAGEVPVLECIDPIFNFGQSNGERPIEHIFNISNKGSGALEIREVRACCGASYILGTNNIISGKSADLKVMLSLSGRSGEQRKSFYLITNDPAQPVYQLRIDGKVAPLIKCEPAVMDFGFVSTNTVTGMTCRVTVCPDLSLSITNSVISSKVFRISEVLKLAKNIYEVKIVIAANLDQGVSRGKVTLFTDNLKYGVVELPIMATVSGEVVVVPKEIRLDGKAKQPATIYIAIRSRTGSNFTVNDIELPDKAMKISIDRMGNTGYRLKLSNVLPFDDLGGKPLVIHTDNLNTRSIQVPIIVMP